MDIILTKDEKKFLINVIDFAIMEGFGVSSRYKGSPNINLDQLLIKLGLNQKQIDEIGT